VAAAAAAAAVKPTVERHGAFRACVSKYSDATEKETGKDTGKERQSEGRGGEEEEEERVRGRRVGFAIGSGGRGCACWSKSMVSKLVGVAKTGKPTGQRRAPPRNGLTAGVTPRHETRL